MSDFVVFGLSSKFQEARVGLVKLLIAFQSLAVVRVSEMVAPPNRFEDLDVFVVLSSDFVFAPLPSGFRPIFVSIFDTVSPMRRVVLRTNRSMCLMAWVGIAVV